MFADERALISSKRLLPDRERSLIEHDRPLIGCGSAPIASEPRLIETSRPDRDPIRIVASRDRPVRAMDGEGNRRRDVRLVAT